jgi:hypothetical protein
VDERSKSVQLTDEQRIEWLRLIRSPNIGPRGIMAQTPQATSVNDREPTIYGGICS